MNGVKLPSIVAIALFAGTTAITGSLPVPAATKPGVAPEMVSEIVSRLIAESIPRRYERSQDWGRTKRITTGLRSSGNFFDFDIHRRKKEVKHGIWKKYRVTLVEPDKNLNVRIDNLRNAGPGRTALSLFVEAKLHGWARAKVYERGIHIIALEAECDTSIRLWLDAEIAVESVRSAAFLPGVAIRPVITGARLALDDFHLRRVSDVRGAIARELGDGLRRVIEDELAGPKLVAKLNRSIEKRRDRLEFNPEKLLGAFDRE